MRLTLFNQLDEESDWVAEEEELWWDQEEQRREAHGQCSIK